MSPVAEELEPVELGGPGGEGRGEQGMQFQDHGQHPTLWKWIGAGLNSCEIC
jgi:hypothetical protein